MTIEQFKRKQYFSSRKRNRSNEEFDQHELYMERKGVNFSIFFKNPFLFYKCYKFLKFHNLVELAEIFLKAAELDLF